MTWGAKVTTAGGKDVQCYSDCKHYEGCYVRRASHSVGNVLTSIDVGADGHMASGTAVLQCNGFEAKEVQGQAG
jgi:hypothetical protein